MKMKYRVGFLVFVILGCLLSCKKKNEHPISERYESGIELRKSIHLSKCHAYHLIANGKVAEGIYMLDSLWQTYHLDDMIPVGVGSAYYKQGKHDSAFYWFHISEVYIDSMIKTHPSESWLRDKLPLAYILRGKEAAKEVERLMSKESREWACIFFETYPNPENFLENAVLNTFEAYKDTNYVR